MKQERSRKAAPADLVIEIALVLCDANRRQLFRKLSISDPPSLQLTLKQVFRASLILDVHGI
ncbi:hypothetical protein WP12_05830 [Sphingomonas sp. SRS2]|nr:hypothetical protein WP12_05830 [Sphingomonas sp. SRS2]